MPETKPVDLWRFIRATYNMEELEGLCFQLGVLFEDLQGETREAKARELVEYLERNDRLDDLAAVLAQERAERFQLTFGATQTSAQDDDDAVAPAGRVKIDTRILSIVGLIVLAVLLIWFVSSLRGRAADGETTPTGAAAVVPASAIDNPAAQLTQATAASAPFTEPTAQESATSPPSPTTETETTAESQTSTTDVTPPIPLSSMIAGATTRTITTSAGAPVTQVFVPAGSFNMGMDTWFIHGPIHPVTLDAFWLDQTEVTNRQYEGCVLAGVCEPPQNVNSFSRNSYYSNDEYDDFPVASVDWHNATAYCEWAGGRLPTEAEWEYAARGPENLIYPWGDEEPSCERANLAVDCVGDTSRAGSYPLGASWVGALDMAGNLYEWVYDWSDNYYYQSSPELNPTGPTSGTFRSVRGSNWTTQFSGSQLDIRFNSDPNSSSITIGFRCAAE